RASAGIRRAAPAARGAGRWWRAHRRKRRRAACGGCDRGSVPARGKPSLRPWPPPLVSDEGERSQCAARFLARIPASWWRRNATALSPENGLLLLLGRGRGLLVLRVAPRLALLAAVLPLGAALRALFRPRLLLLRLVLLGECGQGWRGEDGRQQQDDGFFHQSILAPAALTMRSMRAKSPSSSLANACGESALGSTPCFARRSRIAGSLSSAPTAAFISSTVAFGMPAGTSRPIHESNS